MEVRTIELTPQMDHFKLIYFKKGQGSLFQNNLTKRPVRVIMALTLATIGLYLWGIKKPEQSWLFVVGIFLIAVTFPFLLIKANKFYSWRKQVTRFLHTISQIKTATLTLKQDSFEVKIDERIILQKLNSVKKIEIDPNFIAVYGENENFLFPSGTMNFDDFAQLTQYFRH